MKLLLKRINLFLIVFAFASASAISAKAERLSSMVEGVLESHEDIVNSKKELEEAQRDVTDAMLVYAPDLSIKYEGGQNNKYNASTNSNIDAFHTYDLTWKQKIMDSGASMADVRNKNLSVQKKELELITTRNDLLIEAADAYLGLIKASEKLEASVAAEANTRQTTGQEEIRVQVGSGLASMF